MALDSSIHAGMTGLCAIMRIADQRRSQDISTIISQLFERYREEGIIMSYTFEDFRRDYTREHLHLLSPDEVLSHYKPEQRLTGLTKAQIRAYLERLQNSKNQT